MTDLVNLAINDSIVKSSTIKQCSIQIKKIFDILQIVEPYNETDYYQPILRLQELVCYFEENRNRHKKHEKKRKHPKMIFGKVVNNSSTTHAASTSNVG